MTSCQHAFGSEQFSAVSLQLTCHVVVESSSSPHTSNHCPPVPLRLRPSPTVSPPFAPVFPISSPPYPSTTHASAPEVSPDQHDRKERHASSTFIDSAPGWNEDLATPSEAFIKVRCPPSPVPSPSHAPGRPRDDDIRRSAEKDGRLRPAAPP